MLTLLHGPFHPHLERAFVDEIRAVRADDPLRPVAVAAPSHRLVRRLEALALEAFPGGMVQVYFLPYQALARRVLLDGAPRAPEFADEAELYRVVVERALRENLARSERLGPLLGYPGLVDVLYQTVRDLQDGGIDPVAGIAAVQEGLFDESDREGLAELFLLQLKYREVLERERLTDGTGVFTGAAERAGESPWLASLGSLLCYGFYDMTGAQSEFFDALIRATDVRAFVPMAKDDPAWIFARSLFDRWTGMAKEVRAAKPDLRPARPEVRLVHASGRADEVWRAAKEVLRCVEEDGVRPAEIAVVARSLEGGLREALVAALEENALPVTPDRGPALLAQPIAKAVAQAIGVGEGGYARRRVLELVSSPFFRAAEGDVVEARPDLWDRVSRRLAIRGGAAAWRDRLARVAGRDMPLTGRDPDDERGPVVAAAEVERLRERVERVIAATEGLPAEETWAGHIDAHRALLERLFDPASADDAEREAWATVLETLEGLRGCDRVPGGATRRFFTETLLRVLEKARLRAPAGPVPGVRILDAMAARGLTFPVVIAIGLNERVFPRAIHEEPFLRDRLRRSLNEGLGAALPEKLRGFDEERLLFRMVEEAATRTLVLSWQRSDENGRTLIPSLYLRPYLAEAEAGKLRKESVPLGVGLRLRSVDWVRLTPAEAAMRLPLSGRPAQSCLKACGRRATDYAHAVAAMAEIDRFGALGRFDGLVDGAASWWDRRLARGVAPTSLETFAKCPFQFFAKHVLALEPLPEPEQVVDLSAADQGRLAHGILERTLAAVRDAGGWAAVEPGRARELLAAEAASAFEAFERETPVGYPLLWEARRSLILGALDGFLDRDRGRVLADGFAPLYFEAAASAPIPLAQGSLRFYGQMDRVEVKDAGSELHFRVRDYKTGKRPSDLEGKKLESAIRKGQRLQLPVYLAIGRAFLEAERRAGRLPDRPLIPAGAVYEYLAIDRGEPDEVALEGDFWATAAADLQETLRRFADGIRAGHFFIRPAEGAHGHCSWCEFATMCRKEHIPTARRAEEDARAQEFRERVK